MIEKIINLFNKSESDKVVFDPFIKIKMTPHSREIWIEKICRTKDNYMVTISTMNDCTMINLNAIDPIYLNSILIRLHSLYGPKQPQPENER